jgi:cell division transport system permease protein
VAGVVVTAPFPRRHVLVTVTRNVLRYLFRGAARNWARIFGSTAPALSSMTLLLFLSGLIGLSGFALYNLEQIEAGQASMLHVYLRDDASGTDVLTLHNRLAADPRVVAVGYTSKADALKHAQSVPGLPQLAGASESNPFPASLDVQVKSIDDVGAIDAMVRGDPAVDPVYPTSYDPGAYQRIQAVLLGVGIAGVAFLAILGFVAVAVTVNSIRAAIHSRRDEVAILQLVGAPRWMVRGPFIVEGAITGSLAGLVAGVVTFGMALAGIAEGSASFSQFAPGVTVSVAAVAAAIVFAAGVGLGSGSSLLSVRRHLES